MMFCVICMCVERRLLCETVIKRIYVNEGTITKVELNSPFALIAKAKSSESVMDGGPKGIRTDIQLWYTKKGSAHCTVPPTFLYTRNIVVKIVHDRMYIK